MRILLIINLLLQPVVMQEIQLENLSDGPGLLPFKLGSTFIISHYHSFVQCINLSELQEKISSINVQLDSVTPDLNNKTKNLFEPHLNYLKKKLLSVLEQLQSFETTRVKRGLIDGLGSVVKSITGNLDYTDALHYDSIIKSLEENDNKLVAEYNSHVSISKDWMTQYAKVVDSIVENQNRLTALVSRISQSNSERDSDLIKYAHLAQVLLILSDNVDSISQEVVKLQNVLGFIKVSVAHHSVISLSTIKYLVSRLTSLYGTGKIISLDDREYYDIIGLGSYYVRNEIFIVYKFPIILTQVYDMYKLSIVPNKNHEILIPYHPFLAISLNEYRYIEAECPKTSKGYLCADIRSLQREPSNQPDCIQQLITAQNRSRPSNSSYGFT
ncbi:uncharacterized protein LOC123879879 [Maniola jurtina]|uniref:uncharacterized protein LOC123879879 n=1 Tax=Maniola jurtina TaxID=191418 RepID=UPI001E685E0F|nr:uncharacterized protein LOC123879879 [Maniola jurtina]